MLSFHDTSESRLCSFMLQEAALLSQNIPNEVTFFFSYTKTMLQSPAPYSTLLFSVTKSFLSVKCYTIGVRMTSSPAEFCLVLEENCA